MAWHGVYNISRYLAVALFLSSAKAAKDEFFHPPHGPPCRKSPELASLTLDGKANKQILVAFGGKGWEWRLKRKHGKGKAGEADESLWGKSGKGGDGKLQKEVTFFNDLWTFDFQARTWQEMDAPKGPAPRWKTGTCDAYDKSKFVVMGGCTETSVRYAKNDLWVFTPNSEEKGDWKQIDTSNQPVPRRGHVMVANTTHLTIFGGKAKLKNAETSWKELPEEEDDDESYQPGDKCLIDLWSIKKDVILDEYKEGFARWVQGAPFPAGCRWGATGSYVQSAIGTKFLAVFGGRHLGTGEEEHTTSTSAYTYYNDLWLYDFMEDKWSEAPAVGARPPARDHHGAASVEGRIFIYGGRRSEKREASSTLADLWSYNLDMHTWFEHVPVGGHMPCARFMPGVSSVNVDGQEMLAVFAGEVLPGSTKRTTLNDLWVFNPVAATWTEYFSSTCGNKPDVENLEDLEASSPEWSSQFRWSFIGFLTAGFAVFGLSALLCRDVTRSDVLDASEHYIRVD